MMFILSTNSISRLSLEDSFAVASKTGFDGIEIVIDNAMDTRDPELLLSLSEKYSLKIYSLHAPFRWNIPGWPLRPVESVKRTAELAGKIHAGLVVIHPPIRFVRCEVSQALSDLVFGWGMGNNRSYRNWLISGLKDYQSTMPQKIAVEIMPLFRFAGLSYEQFSMNSLDSMANHFEYIVLDTTHVAASGYDIFDVYSMIKHKLEHIHLSNFSGREHTPINNGRLPMPDFLKQLKNDGYCKTIALEFNQKYVSYHKDRACKVLAENLDNCRRYFD